MFRIVFVFIGLLFFSDFSFAQSPEVMVTTGHSQSITYVAVSPKGRLVASTAANHLIKIWEITSGKEISILNNKFSNISSEERVQTMMFDESGKHLISHDENGKLTIWNLYTEKPVRTFESCSGLQNNMYSGTSKLFAFVDKDYYLTITNYESTLYHIENLDLRVRSVRFVPTKDNLVILETLDQKLYLYDYVQQKIVLTFSSNENVIWRLAVSPNGNYLAVVFTNQELCIFDMQNGEKINSSQNLNQIFDIQFHPFTNRLVVLHSLINPPGQNKMTIIDPKTFEFRDYGKEFNGFCTTFGISSDGDFIACNTMTYKDRMYVYGIDLRDWKSGDIIKTLDSKAHAIYQIVASKKSPIVAAFYNDLNIRIWNLETQQLESTIPFVYKTARNSNSNLLYYIGINVFTGKSEIFVWNLDSSKMHKSKVIDDLLVSQFVCTNDNKHLATINYNGNVIIYNTSNLEIERQYKLEVMGTPVISVSNDLEMIAFGAPGMPDVSIFETKTGLVQKIEESHPYLGVSDLLFSDDKTILYTASWDNKIYAWNTATKQLISEYKGNIGPVSAIVLNTEKKEIASSSWGSTVVNTDYSVHSWNTETSLNNCKLLGHIQNVSAIDFYNGKHILYSGGDDGVLKIWNLDSCREIVSCIAIGFDDYIFVTPDYYYSGSRDALKGVGFKMNGLDLYPFEQFDLRLNRPDIIAERIGLASNKIIDAFKRAYQKRLRKMGFNYSVQKVDFSLPQIRITNADKIPFRSQSRIMDIEIEAGDLKYPVDRIMVWVNDVPVHGFNGISVKSKQPGMVTKKIQVQLSEGNNKIQVSALNSVGTESLKETVFTILPEQGEKHNLYLIAIGVSEYYYKDYNLNYAAKDANDVAEIFNTQKANYDEVFIQKIFNSDATRENILKTKEILKKTTVDDIVMIFIASHGVLDTAYNYYLATTDIDMEKPWEKGLAYDDVENLLDGISARKKIIMVDACHSGEVDKENDVIISENTDENIVGRGFNYKFNKGTSVGLDNSFELMKELFADLRRGSGAVVISSAGGGEFAYESEKLKNGIFTYVLINGIATKTADLNGNGIINITELRNYVIKEVKQLTSGRQNPTARRDNLDFDYQIWKY